MPTLTYPASKKGKLDLLFIGVPFVIIFFLWFIDEGNYNFRWMQEPGNWIVFALYWMAMVLGEFFVSHLIPRVWPTSRKIWFTLGAGIPFGIILVLSFLALVTGYLF